jgi:oxygen-independent coproporphyrinogen-3 oxidase
MIRRDVITEIMCNGFMSFEEIAKRFSVSAEDVNKAVDFHEDKLKQFIADDLVTFQNGELKLKEQGFFVVRNIAMAFDPLLEVKEAQYSKTV